MSDVLTAESFFYLYFVSPPHGNGSSYLFMRPLLTFSSFFPPFFLSYHHTIKPIVDLRIISLCTVFPHPTTINGYCSHLCTRRHTRFQSLHSSADVDIHVDRNISRRPSSSICYSMQNEKAGVIKAYGIKKKRKGTQCTIDNCIYRSVNY